MRSVWPGRGGTRTCVIELGARWGKPPPADGDSRVPGSRAEGRRSDYDVVTDCDTPQTLASRLATWLTTDPVPLALSKLADS